MHHVLVWDKSACDNADLTHIYHVVLYYALENSIQETGLLHNTFSYPDASYIYYIAQNTLCLYKFFYLTYFDVFYYI